MQHQINLLSLSLAIGSIYLAGIAISHYWPRLRGRHPGTFLVEEWLMLGVTISFTAFGVNSLYWWFAFFFQAIGATDAMQLFFSNGQLANIVTRHIPYSAAAMCHLFGFWKFLHDKTHRHPLWHFAVAAGLSAAMWIILQLVAG